MSALGLTTLRESGSGKLGRWAKWLTGTAQEEGDGTVVITRLVVSMRTSG